MLPCLIVLAKSNATRKLIKASFEHGFVDISTVRRFAPADSTPVPVPVQLTKLLAPALALAQVRVRVNFVPAPAQAHVAGGCRRSCHRLHRPRRLFVSHSRSGNNGRSQLQGSQVRLIQTEPELGSQRKL
jgi:hypothetical protein